MSETATPELNKALAAFQAELPVIEKSQKAEIPGKEGKRGYDYKYADLADVTVDPMHLLGKHGLSFRAKPTFDEKDRFVLRYLLAHVSGESDGGDYLLPSPDRVSPQLVGSAITYARRYAFTAVTGIAPKGDDDDGHAAGEVKREDWRSQPVVNRPRPTEAGSPTGRSAAAPAATSSTPAHGSSAAEAPADDQNWGDWVSVIDAIGGVEDADAAKTEIDKAVSEGRMDDVKAAKIKRAMTLKGNTAARRGNTS